MIDGSPGAATAVGRSAWWSTPSRLALVGETSGAMNVMSSKDETSFKAGSGYQGLKAEDSSGSFEATLTTTLGRIAAEAFEISTKAKG